MDGSAPTSHGSARRVRERALIKEIRTPSGSFTDGYWPVTVVARDGRRMRGVRKNEDPFSLQIMTINERILSFDHSDLREVVRNLAHYARLQSDR